MRNPTEGDQRRVWLEEAELIAELNRRLRRHDECADCHFVGPIRRAVHPYGDGGNWLRQLTVRGSPSDPQAAGNKAAEVVVEVAAEYNLRG